MNPQNKGLELIGYVRQSVIKLTEGLSNQQFNFIPDHFNNNIVWNIGHMVFTQQMLCYQLGGLKPTIDMPFFARFAPGTLPEDRVSDKDVAKIRAVFLDAPQQLGLDLQSGLFEAYQGWSLPSGIQMRNIGDAMLTSLVHEGRHFGVVIALSKLLEGSPTLAANGRLHQADTV